MNTDRFCLVGLLVFCLVVGLFVGSMSTIAAYHTQAVAHGCGEYDLQTGKWGWKE